jgi:hypothetical protein
MNYDEMSKEERTVYLLKMFDRWQPLKLRMNGAVVTDYYGTKHKVDTLNFMVYEIAVKANSWSWQLGKVESRPTPHHQAIAKKDGFDLPAMPHIDLEQSNEDYFFCNCWLADHDLYSLVD